VNSKQLKALIDKLEKEFKDLKTVYNELKEASAIKIEKPNKKESTKKKSENTEDSFSKVFMDKAKAIITPYLNSFTFLIIVCFVVLVCAGIMTIKNLKGVSAIDKDLHSKV